MRNIILCGFMGSGKTTVGRRLAALTGRRFLDMDERIEHQAGRTVSEIFAQSGEPDFRRREREICRSLAAEQGLVIAAGGGALTFPENAKTLSASGDIVLLDVSLSVALERLRDDTSRPLLACPEKEARARALYDKRLPCYRAAAGLTVNADGEPGQVAGEICRALGIRLP